MESRESLYGLAIERWGDFNDDIVVVQKDHEMCDMLQCMYSSYYIQGNSIAFPKSGKWSIPELESVQLKYQDDIMSFKESIQRIKDCTEENFHSLCDIEGNYSDSYYVPIMLEE